MNGSVASVCTTTVTATILLVSMISGQKLLVVVVDGLAGSFYYKYSHLPGFKWFEDQGIWSDLLYPEFPTLSLPNRQTLVSGLCPDRHGFVGDYLLNTSSWSVFSHFESPSDLDPSWWNRFEPFYVTVTRNGASVALFFWPECKVPWRPSPSVCVSPLESRTSYLTLANIDTVIEATKSRDLVMVYHNAIAEQVQLVGPNMMIGLRNNTVDIFGRILDRINEQTTERVDLNVLVISTHGMVNLVRDGFRYLEDYLEMDLVKMTVGFGAIMQIVPYSGKTHQIFEQLRDRKPIPNVKIYYTAHRMGDLPRQYRYSRSDLIPELVLIAQPGFAVVTNGYSKKSIPAKTADMLNIGLSGYNNEFPDMLGVFLAFGPAFKRGLRKGPANLVDVYSLMCHILSIKCPESDGNLANFDDILKVSAFASFAIVKSPLEWLFFAAIFCTILYYSS